MRKDLSKIDRKIDDYRKKVKGVEDVRVASEVFDKTVLLTLYDLANRGVIDTLEGVVKTGKEANVFRARDSDGASLAVKIYRIATTDFRTMWRYIEGDHRFEKTKKKRRDIVYAWVSREFKNLERAVSAGVPAPRPIVAKKNILVMDFIGIDDEPCPMMKQVKLEDPEGVYKDILEGIKSLYCNAKMVHGDLSEYNVLMQGNKPILIDFSMGVPRSHLNAEELLRRDIKNLTRFFGRYMDVDKEEYYKYVTSCEKEGAK